MPKEKGKLNAGGQWVKSIYNHIREMLPATETEIYRACFEMDGLLPDKVDDFLIDLTKMGYIKNRKEVYYLIEIEPKKEEEKQPQEKIDNELAEWRALRDKKAKEDEEEKMKEDEENGKGEPLP